MVAPILRSFSKPTAGTVNVETLMTDDITGLTFIQLARPNQLLDAINSPDPASTQTFKIQLYKNSISTGRYFFTVGMSAASAGRQAIGPIDLSPGQVLFGSTQLAGTATTHSAVFKFAATP